MKKSKSYKSPSENGGSYGTKKSKKSNILAAVFCVLLAFILWIYVMNMENGEYTKTFSLPIEILGEQELLESRDLKVYKTSETVTYADVTVQGIKTIVQKYTEEDFRASIDVSDITKKGYVSVEIHVEMPSSTVKAVSIEPVTVKLLVDHEATREVPLNIHGSSQGIDFVSEVKTATISGPEAYISDVVYAEAKIPDGTYSVGDEFDVSALRLYAEDGRQLSSLNLKVEPESVTVKVKKSGN